MVTEAMNLTAQIVIAHASTRELTTKELLEEIKDIYAALASLDGGEIALESAPGAPGKQPEAIFSPALAARYELKKPAIPLDEIVKEKYVVCLECGRQMRTLKAHLRRTHQLAPADYFRRYSLDPKKFPLVCKEYSEQRRKLAKKTGLGERGLRRQAAS